MKEKSTKEKILDAMFELLAQGGYDKASMRKIAKKVGIRESAIYNHFKNKEAIFEAILERLFTNAFEDFFKKRPLEESARRGKKFLQEFVMAYKLIAFDPKQEHLFRIVLLEIMRNETVRKLFLKHYFDANIKVLSTAFFIMMQEELIRSEDPKLMAYEFLSPLFTMRLQITLLRFDSESTTPFSTLFERHVEFFWASIANSAANSTF